MEAAISPSEDGYRCRDADTYVPDMQPGPALNALDPMGRSIENRDSTLHLAAGWLRCISRRLIEAPAMGRPRDAIVSRQLRHLFADLDLQSVSC
jgi:hypothetical protein